MDAVVSAESEATSRAVLDLAAGTESLATAILQVNALANAWDGLASIIDEMSKTLNAMSQAIQQSAASATRVLKTVAVSLRDFFEEQGLVRLKSAYVPGARLIALRRQDISARWAALLSHLRRGLDRPTLHSQLRVLTAQPNGPNRSIDIHFAIGLFAGV